MSQGPQTKVRISRQFGASAERVFDAWLEPATARRFLGVANEEPVQLAIDPRVGGQFGLQHGGPGKGKTGEYLMLDRPRRLVFSWSTSQQRPDLDLVTVYIVSLGASCELVLVHEMRAAGADEADAVARSWNDLIDQLATTIGAAPPSPVPAPPAEAVEIAG